MELARGGGGQRQPAPRWIRSVAGPGPLHIGVLLGNVPEYIFWLGAAALAGAVVVGINPTRRGEALAGDIRAHRLRRGDHRRRRGRLLDGLDFGVPADRVIRIDDPAYAERGWRPRRAPTAGRWWPRTRPAPEHLYLLLFTSGTTGAPKAVRCTQGRLASIAVRSAGAYGFDRDDVAYCTMPLFHGNALMVLWGPSLVVGATVALARRFSASGFVADVRRYGATTFTYVGKALAYVLATPPAPDDASTHPAPRVRHRGLGRRPRRLRAPVRLRAHRGVRLERGGDGHQPDAGHPGRLARPSGRRHRHRRPRDAGGVPAGPVRRRRAAAQRRPRPSARSSTGPASAGSRGTTPTRRPPPSRTRNGWYWTGDLAYRDEDGFFYFAGRRGDWMRVDSENLTAGPIERVLVRYDRVAAVAVYSVPDPRSGDQVMAALELLPDRAFDPAGFAAFLEAQPDLGTKWAPSFVRVTGGLPQTASGKVTKDPAAGRGLVGDGRARLPAAGDAAGLCARWTTAIGGRWWPSSAATAGTASSVAERREPPSPIDAWTTRLARSTAALIDRARQLPATAPGHRRAQRRGPQVLRRPGRSAGRTDLPCRLPVRLPVAAGAAHRGGHRPGRPPGAAGRHHQLGPAPVPGDRVRPQEQRAPAVDQQCAGRWPSGWSGWSTAACG